MTSSSGPSAETDLIKLYSARILALTTEIPLTDRLAAPDATVRRRAPLCGSTVTVDVTVADGRVTGYGQEVKACALGQASSSLMARHVIGATGDELREVRGQMYAMLKEGGPPPGGKWEELAVLEPVRDFKARHASTLLTFDAVCDAVGQIERAGAPAARDG